MVKAMGFRMRVAVWLAAVALAALPAAAGAGRAKGKLAGAGVIAQVDVAGKTLTVGDEVMSVSSRTILLDLDGRKLSLRAFVEFTGRHALYFADPSRPHAVLRHLALVDPDEDHGG